MNKSVALQKLWHELKKNKLDFTTLLEVMSMQPSLCEEAWQEYLNLLEKTASKHWQYIDRELAQIFRTAPELREKVLKLIQPGSADGNFALLMYELAKEFPEESLAITKRLLQFDSWQGSIHMFFRDFPELIDELWPVAKEQEPESYTYSMILENVPLLREEAAEFLLAHNSRCSEYMQKIIIHVPKHRQKAWGNLLKCFEGRKKIASLVIKVPEFYEAVFEVLEELPFAGSFEYIAMQSNDPTIRARALKNLAACSDCKYYFNNIFTDKANQECKLAAAKVALGIKDLSYLTLYYIIIHVPEFREQAWQKFIKQQCLDIEQLFHILYTAPELKLQAWQKVKEEFFKDRRCRSYLTRLIELDKELRHEAANLLLDKNTSRDELIVIMRHVPEEREIAWQMFKKFQPNQETISDLCKEIPELAFKLPEVPVAPKQILAAMAVL